MRNKKIKNTLLEHLKSRYFTSIRINWQKMNESE